MHLINKYNIYVYTIKKIYKIKLEYKYRQFIYVEVDGGQEKGQGVTGGRVF